jgi:hypothetical protein
MAGFGREDRTMTEPVLTRRQLNRTTLDRQLLLERDDRDPVAAISHLVGLQAQNPLDPYSALWSRLAGFEPGLLAGLLESRVLVRIVVMRGTIHLVTADDALVLRAMVQPVLDAELARHAEHKHHLADVDLTEPLAFAAALMDESPRSCPQLRAAFAERFGDVDPAALVYACRNHLALVQVPPRGVWGKKLQVTYATTEAWLGRSMDPHPSVDDVVLRYLAAFGPATVADVAAWSRLTAQGEVLERLRPRVRTYRDENGRELFDVAGATITDPETPAPVRFLPEYDNVLLSHADRSRFLAPGDDRSFGHIDRTVHGTVLHDGVLAGTWNLPPDPAAATATATISVDLAVKLPKRAVASVEAEGRRFVRFKTDGTVEPDVRVLPPA